MHLNASNTTRDSDKMSTDLNDSTGFVELSARSERLSGQTSDGVEDLKIIVNCHRPPTVATSSCSATGPVRFFCGNRMLCRSS